MYGTVPFQLTKADLLGRPIEAKLIKAHYILKSIDLPAILNYKLIVPLFACKHAFRCLVVSAVTHVAVFWTTL